VIPGQITIDEALKAERVRAMRALRRALQHGGRAPAWDHARLAKYQGRVMRIAARVVQLDGRAGEDASSSTSRDVPYEELARVIAEARGTFRGLGG
jgi:hypothetical protein